MIKHQSKVNLTIDEQHFMQNHPEVVLASGSSLKPFVIRNLDGSVADHDIDTVNLDFS